MENPAESVIRRCGGHAAVRRMLNVNISRVYRWTYPKEKGGTGGHIPAKHQVALLEAARSAGIDLKPDDFFPKGAA